MAPHTTLNDKETAFVQRMRVARLATADEHGNPHVIPACYAFDGTYFYIALDEKPKRVEVTRLQRVHNIEVRPEVSLVVDQYSDDWSQLGYVLIFGRAELIAPEHERHAPALELLRMRYVQYRTMNLERNPVIMITVDRVTAWGQGIRV